MPDTSPLPPSPPPSGQEPRSWRDDPRTLRAVDFRAIFPVLHLGRAFNTAVRPAMLLLALALILMWYGVGRAMDWAWPYQYPIADRQVDDLPTTTLAAVTEGMRTSGPFDVFMKFQLSRLHDVTEAVLDLRPGRVVENLYRFAFEGPGWGLGHHPVFAAVFGLVVLLGWAVFGGAIARVAAVYVAREEKISAVNALRFSTGKLLSFVFAPVILALFMGFMGLAISVINLLFYIPQAGPVLVGAGFVVTLLIGLVLALTVFGTVGGSGLMYPAIAVEGSDAFDSISRSFSYFFARPWKLLGYSLAALVYGVVTYLGVKLFVYVMLVLIRAFQVWFLASGGSGYGAEPGTAERFGLFFPPPDYWSLSYDLDYELIRKHLGVGGVAGAGLLSFWYYLVVGLLGAYAVSFYFSATTVIYMLLRQDVDATELDDVYLEEGDEEDLTEAPPTGSTSVTTPAPATPAATVTAPGTVSAEAGEDKGEQPPTFSAPPIG